MSRAWPPNPRPESLPRRTPASPPAAVSASRRAPAALAAVRYRILGWRTSSAKCQIASSGPDGGQPLVEAGCADYHDGGAEIVALGLVWCLHDASATRFKKSVVPDVCRRLRHLRIVARGIDDRAVLCKQLVLPMFTWCAGFARPNAEEEDRIRNNTGEAMLAPKPRETPPLLAAEVAGWEVDPGFACDWAALRCLVRRVLDRRRWLDDAPLACPCAGGCTPWGRAHAGQDGMLGGRSRERLPDGLRWPGSCVAHGLGRRISPPGVAASRVGSSLLGLQRETHRGSPPRGRGPGLRASSSSPSPGAGPGFPQSCSGLPECRHPAQRTGRRPRCWRQLVVRDGAAVPSPSR